MAILKPGLPHAHMTLSYYHTIMGTALSETWMYSVLLKFILSHTIVTQSNQLYLYGISLTFIDNAYPGNWCNYRLYYLLYSPFSAQLIMALRYTSLTDGSCTPRQLLSSLLMFGCLMAFFYLHTPHCYNAGLGLTLT